MAACALIPNIFWRILQRKRLTGCFLVVCFIIVHSWLTGTSHQSRFHTFKKKRKCIYFCFDMSYINILAFLFPETHSIVFCIYFIPVIPSFLIFFLSKWLCFTEGGHHRPGSAGHYDKDHWVSTAEPRWHLLCLKQCNIRLWENNGNITRSSTSWTI